MPFAELPGDLRMHYEDDDFSDPWKTPETVVFHHGQAKSGRLWYAWVPLLAGEYRVIRVDGRGFGRSKAPAPGCKWSLEGFAEDVVHLMDYLGIDKAHLIGDTIGGSISLVLAHDYPGRVRTVTTCTSPFRFRGDPAYGQYYDMVKEGGVAAWVGVNNTLDDPDHTRWYREEMSKTNQRVVLETLAALQDVDLTDMLKEIKIPALVMTGESASAWEAGRARAMAELLPNGRLALAPGAGRAHHSNPAVVAALWREFVKSV